MALSLQSAPFTEAEYALEIRFIVQRHVILIMQVGPGTLWISVFHLDPTENIFYLLV